VSVFVVEGRAMSCLNSTRYSPHPLDNPTTVNDQPYTFDIEPHTLCVIDHPILLCNMLLNYTLCSGSRQPTHPFMATRSAQGAPGTDTLVTTANVAGGCWFLRALNRPCSKKRKTACTAQSFMLLCN